MFFPYFFEKMAEILFLEACHICDLIEGKGTVVMIVGVVHDQFQAVEMLFGSMSIL